MTGAVREGLRIGLSCESYPASADEPMTIARGITGYVGGLPATTAAVPLM